MRGSAEVGSAQPDSGRISVALVHDTTEFGGLEVVLLRILERIDRTRFNPFVVVTDGVDELRRSPDELVERVTKLGVPIVRYSTFGASRLGPVREVANLAHTLRRSRADVVHIHTCRADGARKMGMAARLAGVPVVLRTEHNSPTAFTDMPANTRARRFADRFVDLTLTVSDHDRGEQIEIVGRSPEKVRTLHNGVDVTQFDPDRIVLAPELLPDGFQRPVVGAVGRLSEQKGYADLVRATATLAHRGLRFSVVLVGAGPLESELKRLAASLAVEDRVLFAGRQADPRPWIKTMDVAVMPSLHEGFSLSLLEYMSMARPTVVTDHPGLLEAVTSETSIVVPRSSPEALAEAIAVLLADEPRRREMGAAARCRVVERFGIDAYIDSTESLWIEMLAAQ